MPAYHEKFPVGSLVRIAPGPALGRFMQDWKFHHPLQPEQIPFAGTVARISDVSFYHGGDPLYEIAGVPGIWHEQCLDPAP